MKNILLFIARCTFYIILFIGTNATYAQMNEIDLETEFYRRSLNGPRLGITIVPPNSELGRELKDNGMDPLISQFGWHFEWQVIPEGRGPVFVIQTVPLLAGVEYGKIIPSLTLAMGIRLPNGIEFGIGPNVLIGGKKTASTALVAAVGKSFNYGGVSIPINLAFASNPTSKRISLLVGYAID